MLDPAVLIGTIASLRAQADYVPIIFKSSRTWVAPSNGVILAYGIGAGGSGGLCIRTSGGASRATGGGSGGWSMGISRVQSGQSVVVTVGAGAGLAARTTVGNFNGIDGGNTTVSVAGTQIMLAPGGKGGKAAASKGLVAGGLGGTGGVGKIVVPGRNAGACLATNTSDGPVASGGAAVDIMQLGQPNADVGGVTGADSIGQGGAGIGGIGFADSNARGGGSGGPASSTAIGPNFNGQTLAASVPGLVPITPFLLDVFGGGSDSANDAGPGGGGVGGSGGAVTLPGACAGSGGIGNIGYNANTAAGGMFGGGSGGHASYNSVSSGVGAGGQGYAILYFKPI